MALTQPTKTRMTNQSSNPLTDSLADTEAVERYQQSYATALRLLARREHSELELRRKLLSRKIAHDLVDRVIDELTQERLLSNQRFVEAYVHVRFERGYGPVRIRSELMQRGIDAGEMSASLQALEGQWLDSLEHQREKRFGPVFPADYRERTRQMRFLQQRGFTEAQIREVL